MDMIDYLLVIKVDCTLLNFQSSQGSFLSSYEITFLICSSQNSFFSFSLCKIVRSENSPDNYKILKVTIRAIIKNPENLTIRCLSVSFKICS